MLSFTICIESKHFGWQTTGGRVSLPALSQCALYPLTPSGVPACRGHQADTGCRSSFIQTLQLHASDTYLPQQALCGRGRQPWTPVQVEHTRVLPDLLSCTRRGHFLLHRADAESLTPLTKHCSSPPLEQILPLARIQRALSCISLHGCCTHHAPCQFAVTHQRTAQHPHRQAPRIDKAIIAHNKWTA